MKKLTHVLVRTRNADYTFWITKPSHYARYLAIIRKVDLSDLISEPTFTK